MPVPANPPPLGCSTKDELPIITTTGELNPQTPGNSSPAFVEAHLSAILLQRSRSSQFTANNRVYCSHCIPYTLGPICSCRPILYVRYTGYRIDIVISNAVIFCHCWYDWNSERFVEQVWSGLYVVQNQYLHCFTALFDVHWTNRTTKSIRELVW